MKRVLRDLRDDGLVIAPGHGWWRWIGSSENGLPISEEPETCTTASVDEAIDDLNPRYCQNGKLEPDASAFICTLIQTTGD